VSESYSSTVDKYLEAIFYIAAEGEVVRPGRLAQWLSVRPPTVTNALARLVRDDLVEIHDDRSVTLTSRGSDTAASLVRRHRILERWLTHELGFDWASADDEAEQLSSSISDQVLERIDASLGYPTTCPHGNVIPGREAPYGPLHSLASCAVGRVVQVRRISEVAEHEARQLLETLAEHHLAEGVELRVTATADDGISVALGEDEFTLEVSAAQLIWVEAVSA
jgi:DtxR family Mn-dependent transcriptional regulator